MSAPNHVLSTEELKALQAHAPEGMAQVDWAAWREYAYEDVESDDHAIRVLQVMGAFLEPKFTPC